MLHNVLLSLRCSAETAKINLIVFLIHVVLRSGAEMFTFLQWKKKFCIFTHVVNIYANLLEQKKAFT